MNGSRTLDVLRELIQEVFGEQYTTVLESVQRRLQSLLLDGFSREDSPNLADLARVMSPDPSEGLRPIPGPRVLHWWVTSVCPRKCVYCFAQPTLGTKADDATVTRAQLQRIFKEAAELGTEHLLVAGAEPFLRDDLPEVMGDAIQQGMTPLLTTKYPITRSLAERLRDGGLQHISLSLDTMDEAESQTLIGSNKYPAVVRSSVDNLTKSGVAFSIQAVVTKLNTRSVGAIAEFAARTGAKLLQVVPFEPVVAPIGPVSNSDMNIGQAEWLDTEVSRLTDQYPSLKIERFEELGSGSRSGYHCDIGMTKLFFLPNGVVHRCYKLTHDTRLQGKDLRRTSLAAAWHDPGFHETISPPREAYAHTDCHSCSRFSHCHDDGRCIYQAWRDRNRYEARDRNCNGPYVMSSQSQECKKGQIDFRPSPPAASIHLRTQE
jgi:MoaA/NifB/PqqE/SkfB family radical SAM enzyme